MSTVRTSWRAAQMLVLANACWGLSFPTTKALALVQAPLLPRSNSWFLASSTLALRFSIAFLVLWLAGRTSLRRITRLEAWEGFGLGAFASVGLIFQMDGLLYTSASTSAFLTQFYCLTIPLWVACRQRRWPSPTTIVSCLLVIAGVAVLSEIDWHTLRIGRGEWETLVGSTIFTGQILWLQRPLFSRNNVNHFTLVMFAVIAAVCFPVALATGEPRDPWLAAWLSKPALCFLGIMTGFCTLGGYLLMNYWQPFLTATQAGLIYCLEPVFASLFALFLPGWFSAWSGIDYANEQFGWGLAIGGGLITVANVLMQLDGRAASRDDEIGGRGDAEARKRGEAETGGAMGAGQRSTRPEL